MNFLADSAARLALIQSRPQAALVSESLPLRANLSVLENIAIVPQYRRNVRFAEAADMAWALLEQVGHTACALKRDPDIDHTERFVAKLLRALVLEPPIILIDRPAQLLPDTHYPPFLESILGRLEGRFAECWILDYAWNEPLYAPR